MMNRSDWQLQQIEVVAENRVVVTMANGNSRVRLYAPEFGIGRPGKQAAALAKFAASRGLGDVERLYSFITAIPEDYCDVLPFPLRPLRQEHNNAEW